MCWCVLAYTPPHTAIQGLLILPYKVYSYWYAGPRAEQSREKKEREEEERKRREEKKRREENARSVILNASPVGATVGATGTKPEPEPEPEPAAQ